MYDLCGAAKELDFSLKKNFVAVGFLSVISGGFPFAIMTYFGAGLSNTFVLCLLLLLLLLL